MGSRLRDTGYLFELFCEVSPGDHVQEPYILRKYPEPYRSESDWQSIPKFTFPCQLTNNFVQLYSFVLTSGDSKYSFCFCRYDPKSKTALVLLSHLSWHDTFYDLLNCIAKLINSPEKGELNAFLEACRIRPPMPGHTLKVTYNAGQSVFSCQNPGPKLPSIPENCNITEYFSAVDTKSMAGLWAALLHERRVAIIASKPSRLSACVQAANATLFPMSWQHIFIPIMPKHLVDYLSAPMPFLVGVPRSVMETVRKSEIGEMVILDIDANELRTPFNDLETLPPEVVNNLKKALSDKNALGDAVSRAFLRALVCLIGGYRDALKLEHGEKITFNPEAFVHTRKNMQPFLKEVLKTQIFQQFIDERLELLNSGRGFNDEFEVESGIYSERLNKGSGQRLKQQYKDWAKNVKKEGGAFFKTVKDKANPAVQSAVKTVRQGGKNVKSAVRGLKNKMPMSGSRPPSNKTLDDSRYSCGSVTSVSSDSEASPAREPREPAPSLPLELLNEMETLFDKSRSDTLPNNSRNSELSADKAKTLSPSIPPRVPDRPIHLLRYPIIPTRKLVDLSDAPLPPPRVTAKPAGPHFISNIVKDGNSNINTHTSTISFAEFSKDKAKLKLTMSSQRVEPSNISNGTLKSNLKAIESPLLSADAMQKRMRPPRYNGVVQESVGSETDLINLDDSPSNLEEFDPLKRRDQTNKEQIKSTDSALLHEYGLDFALFDFESRSSNNVQESSTSNSRKGWTKFN